MNDRLSVPIEKIGIPDKPRCSLDFEIQGLLQGDALRLQSFSGSEAISQEFEFSLDIRANDYWFANGEYIADPGNEEGAAELDIDSLLMAPATVMIGLPETDSEAAEEPYPSARQLTYFNGVIHSVSMADRGVWKMIMKPRLSLLHLQSSYRIFSDKTALEVITEVLRQNRIDHTSTVLADNRPGQKKQSSIVCGPASYKRQDWFQAGESDFEFVTRLMEKSGIFFYFVHEYGKHKMVLTDQSYYAKILKNPERRQYVALPKSMRQQFDQPDASFGADVMDWNVDDLKVLYLTAPKLGVDLADTASQFSFQRNLTVGAIDTLLTAKNPAWEPYPPSGKKPSTGQDDTRANSGEVRGIDVGGVGPNFAGSTKPLQSANSGIETARKMQKVQTLSYGSTKKELEFRNKQLEQQLLSAQHSLTGTCSLAELRSGHSFAIQGGERNRPELSRRVMVAQTVSHHATASGEYSNQFSAFFAEGFGKPFDGAADRDGSIIAKVCRKPRSGGGADADAAPEDSQDQSNALAKSEFSLLDKKKYQYQERSQQEARQKGVWVQFIGAKEGFFVDDQRYFVRLADHMTSIPEIGSVVIVGRTRDDSELPVVEQVINAYGSKTILNDHLRSKHTSVGNSYNTNYGNSYNSSLPLNPVTDYQIFNKIVEDQRQINEGGDSTGAKYPNVSFNEGSPSYSVHVGYSGRSRSKSVVKPEGTNDFEQLEFFKEKLAQFQNVPTLAIETAFSETPTSVSSYDGISHSYTGQVQNFSYSEDYSTSFTESHTHGSSYHLSVDHTSGNHSQSIVLPPGDDVDAVQSQFPDVPTSAPSGKAYDEIRQSFKGAESNSYSYSKDEGYSHSVSYSSGDSYSESHSSGDSHQISHSSGDSYSESRTSGNSRSVSHSTGDSYSESHGNTSTSNSTMAATASASAVGASTSSSVVGVTNSNSVVGLSNNNSVTGIGTSLSAHISNVSISAKVRDVNISATAADDIDIKMDPSGITIKAPPGDVKTFNKPQVEIGPALITIYAWTIML